MSGWSHWTNQGTAVIRAGQWRTLDKAGKQRILKRRAAAASEVEASCWGKPRRTVKKTTAAGVEEHFVYGGGHIVKFTDGKVVEIVESR